MATGSVTRGCGTRSPGGAYLVTSLGPGGMPLEDLIIDPPRPVNAHRLGLSPQGVALADNAVLDWVGLESYPNVADYVEEVALFGSSRRVPTTFTFGALKRDARHILLHPRALVKNAAWLLANRAPRPWAEANSWLYRCLDHSERLWCPFHAPHEADPDLDTRQFCATLWWELLAPKSVQFADNADDFDRQCGRTLSVRRQMPAFDFTGYTLPDQDVWVPEWQLGAFLSLPITRIEVVRDPEDETHKVALSRAVKADLPVELMDD